MLETPTVHPFLRAKCPQSDPNEISLLRQSHIQGRRLRDLPRLRFPGEDRGVRSGGLSGSPVQGCRTGPVEALFGLTGHCLTKREGKKQEPVE